MWCDFERCEERDNSFAVTKQFFALGQKNSSTAYFYDLDHIGSRREVTDSSAVVQAQYNYDPYGSKTVISEAVPADFQFTGDYFHSRSGLSLTPIRAYSPQLGRWLSREPLGESISVNLYEYVYNNPTSFIDPLGSNPALGALAGTPAGPLGTLIGAGIGGLLGIGAGWGLWGWMHDPNGPWKPKQKEKPIVNPVCKSTGTKDRPEHNDDDDGPKHGVPIRGEGDQYNPHGIGVTPGGNPLAPEGVGPPGQEHPGSGYPPQTSQGPLCL